MKLLTKIGINLDRVEKKPRPVDTTPHFRGTMAPIRRQAAPKVDMTIPVAVAVTFVVCTALMLICCRVFG